MQLVSTYDRNYFSLSPLIEAKDTIHGVECSFDETYLLIGKNDNRAVRHELKSRMCIEESDTLTKWNFKNNFYQRIKNHCKPYLRQMFYRQDIQQFCFY